ncbi:MAG: translation elongation factor Ts, partial [Gemmataceae bacterium]|nr:translation elongation factor Ts [Gemmataceae bacterium]
KTGLPMMECKKALQETGGNQEAAIEHLRKQGIKTAESRIGRETSEGRIALHIEAGKSGAMVEVLCESAPVAGGADLVDFANACAKQLATGPGAKAAEDLLRQPSPSKPGMTLEQQLADIVNRIREVIKLNRIVRIDGSAGGYVHHNAKVGVLLQVEGGTAELAKDISMHVAALHPSAVTKEDLDPALVAKEREILLEAARKEGKPENILEKMVEGRMKNFYAEKVLLEQPFVKDDKQTVGKVASAGGMKILRMERWELAKS